MADLKSDINPGNLFEFYLRDGTLTRAKLCAFLHDTFGYSLQEAKVFVDTYIDEIVKTLQSGESVQLRGFGVFEIKNKAARKGRNIKTGEEVMIPAGKKVTFRASNKLKQQIKDMNS